jgi:hypothetical protein
MESTQSPELFRTEREPEVSICVIMASVLTFFAPTQTQVSACALASSNCEPYRVHCGLSASTENAFCSPMARERTGLHFEALYESCIHARKMYHVQEGGQDLRRKAHFAVSNYVQVQEPSPMGTCSRFGVSSSMLPPQPATCQADRIPGCTYIP